MRGNKIVMWIIGGVGAAVLIVGVGLMIRDRQMVAEARDWPSVEGRIDSAFVATEQRSGRRGSRRTRYIPRISYRYVVGGTTYTNNHIWLTGAPDYSSHEPAADVLRDYPRDRPVRVFHSPADPRRAALRIEAEQTGNWVAILIGALFLGIAWWIRTKIAGQAMQAGMPQPGQAPPPTPPSFG